jgi:hypothetical protein
MGGGPRTRGSPEIPSEPPNTKPFITGLMQGWSYLGGMFLWGLSRTTRGATSCRHAAQPGAERASLRQQLTSSRMR